MHAWKETAVAQPRLYSHSDPIETLVTCTERTECLSCKVDTQRGKMILRDRCKPSPSDD